MTKVAIVVQRYGEDLVGGAESHAREIAEALFSKLGWEVDVLTTCAKDYRTWKNEYAEETFVLNGVKVRRFRSLFGRSSLFGMYNRFVTPVLLKLRNIKFLRPFLAFFEWIWVLLQGPVNIRLARYLKDHVSTYDRFFFFTYLYLPTLWGVRICKEKSILIPTAHDEAPFYFSLYQTMLNQVTIILANSPAEKKLIAQSIQNPHKIRIAGLGFNPHTGAVERSSSDTPYVLYLGRLSKGKGVDQLIRYFLNYVQTKNKHLHLVLAGKLDEGFQIPQHANIQYLGFVDGEKKNTLIHNALCIINPSPLESLSLLVLEAIVRERPVLVNTDCEVLKDYVDACESVWGFGSGEEFLVNLHTIFSQNWTDEIHSQKLAEAKRWAEGQYSWEKVLQEYEVCIENRAGNKGV